MLTPELSKDLLGLFAYPWLWCSTGYIKEVRIMEESLNTYRQERRAFIAGLKHYFNVDFYKLDRRERTEWFQSYLLSKREFFSYLMEHWQENPPKSIDGFPLKKSKKKTKVVVLGGRLDDDRNPA